jgi:hypothetical protein
MILAGPNNAASQALSFLSTSIGQVVLAILSVIFIVLVKTFLRPSGERAFQKDDLLVGPDLIVLSIVTLIGYAASQFVAERNADAISDFKNAAIYSSHQVNAAFLSVILIAVLFFETMLIQRYGQFSSARRAQDRSNELGEGQRIRGLLLEEERQIREPLEARIRKLEKKPSVGSQEPCEEEGSQESSEEKEKRIAKLQEDLQKNLKEFLDVPRYRIAGLIFPDLFGIFMLIIAIKSAVQ